MLPPLVSSGLTCPLLLQTRVYRNVDFSVDEGYAAVPDLPVPISHPQTATVLALPLDPAKNYSVEVC